jgi:hypothetical protein
MTILYRASLVLGLLLLVIFGLNISNQGMNSLTLQNRKPVVGLQMQGNTINIYTLGESHSYAKQALASKTIQVRDRVRGYGQVILKYILKIAELIRVYLLK